MSARARSCLAPRAILAGAPLVVLVVALGACLPLPTQTASASPSATPRATPTAEPSITPEATPRPYSLENPAQQDDRLIRVTVAANLATDASGQVVVTVTNLDATRITEIVLRWSTSLDEHLYLAPFVPSPDRICEGCPPLVQPWTKWVWGPGESGEPAGTTSLGWGPLDPGATLIIPVIANRRRDGPVDFDLQLLAGEALLRQEGGQPAWLRVAVP
jgi:hypothetical protein